MLLLVQVWCRDVCDGILSFFLTVVALSVFASKGCTRWPCYWQKSCWLSWAKKISENMLMNKPFLWAVRWFEFLRLWCPSSNPTLTAACFVVIHFSIWGPNQQSALELMRELLSTCTATSTPCHCLWYCCERECMCLVLPVVFYFQHPVSEKCA